MTVRLKIQKVSIMPNFIENLSARQAVRVLLGSTLFFSLCAIAESVFQFEVKSISLGSMAQGSFFAMLALVNPSTDGKQ